VPEAMMIAPTETESRETLESFAGVLCAIAEEDPQLLHHAPHTTPTSRPDEVKAVKTPVLRFRA
jgi:glycine dehydrogenase subunit 2